eukprot:1421132-Rhodomonas_salina.1
MRRSPGVHSEAASGARPQPTAQARPPPPPVPSVVISLLIPSHASSSALKSIQCAAPLSACLSRDCSPLPNALAGVSRGKGKMRWGGEGKRGSARTRGRSRPGGRERCGP